MDLPQYFEVELHFKVLQSDVDWALSLVDSSCVRSVSFLWKVIHVHVFRNLLSVESSTNVLAQLYPFHWDYNSCRNLNVPTPFKIFTLNCLYTNAKNYREYKKNSNIGMSPQFKHRNVTTT
jgi:hypothetical protein